MEKCNLPIRKQLRLKDFDYTQSGCYFVTICTNDRQKTLSELCKGIWTQDVLLLRPLGKIVETQITELTKRYNVEIDPYVIMPNHIHMIIKTNAKNVRDRVERECEISQAGGAEPRPYALGEIICTFKSLTTKIANKSDACPGRKIWQRGYYEHVIRNEEDYWEKAEYILSNPFNQEE